MITNKSHPSIIPHPETGWNLCPASNQENMAKLIGVTHVTVSTDIVKGCSDVIKVPNQLTLS